MATKEWLGDGSANLFNVAGNWKPSGVPGASDVALFNSVANNRDCNFDLTTGSSITIGEIIVESDYGGSVVLQTVPVTKAIYLGSSNGIKAGSASSIDFRQGSSGSEFGSYKSFNNRFLLVADGGSWSGSITLNMYSGSAVTKFDDGDHATTVLKTGFFAPNYVAPTGTSGKTTFSAFTADNGITFQPTGNLVDNDRLKHFDFGSFTFSDDLFNAGAATCEFKATSSGIHLPITGATGYGQNPSGNPSDFVSYMRKVILNADTAGHKILMRDNSYVSLEELEIGDGVMFKGPTGLAAQGSDIRLVNAPKIRGSWSFSQISQGVYRSPRQASGPMPKITGSLEITDKLTVGGLIDPTGLVIDEKASVAATGHTTVAGKGLLWVKTGSPNELYFTNEDGDDVQITSGSSIAGGGGGGGSGTVTSIATTAPITGGTITNTGTIGISAATTSAAGSMSSADKTKLDGIEASADVTDTANVTAAGALMDSEVTNLADVKSFDPADYATAAQGQLADTALQALVEDPAPEVQADLNLNGNNIVQLSHASSILKADASSILSAATAGTDYQEPLIFCEWDDISADITANHNTNTLINNWSYNAGNTDIRDAMSSGVWTCTADLAGTYLVLAKVMFGQGTLSETNNVRYSMQMLNYKNAGGGTPSAGTLTKFARQQNNKFYLGHILESTFILTMADTDTFGVYAKIQPQSGSGNFKIKSGANTQTSLVMIKIA